MTTVTLAGIQVDAGIVRKIDAAAARDGVPRNVVRATALMETGGDPDAIGDGGASIGLLQLHEQGQGAGMTAAQRLDPDTNLRVGVPPIAAAHAANGHLPKAERFRRTLAESGHPGDPLLFEPGSAVRRRTEDAIETALAFYLALEAEDPEPPAASFAGVVPVFDGERLTRIADGATAWAAEHRVATAALALLAIVALAA